MQSRISSNHGLISRHVQVFIRCSPLLEDQQIKTGTGFQFKSQTTALHRKSPSMADHLATATLIIYAILLQPTLYCFWAHGRHGFLGWFYLQIFCLLRIVGNAVELHAATNLNPKSSHVQLINNIGLSPLLLATAGILHEA